MRIPYRCTFCAGNSEKAKTGNLCYLSPTLHTSPWKESIDTLGRRRTGCGHLSGRVLRVSDPKLWTSRAAAFNDPLSATPLPHKPRTICDLHAPDQDSRSLSPLYKVTTSSAFILEGYSHGSVTHPSPFLDALSVMCDGQTASVLHYGWYRVFRRC